MPKRVKNTIVCVLCGKKIVATLDEAMKNGWRIWLGGAQCPRTHRGLPST